MKRLVHSLGPTLSLIAWTLPFARVQGCGESEARDWSGLEILSSRDTGLAWLGVLVALLLLGFALWRPSADPVDRALRNAVRMHVAGWGLFGSVLLPMIHFLLASLQPLVGLWTQCAGWALTWGIAGLALFEPLPAPRGEAAPTLRRVIRVSRWGLLAWPLWVVPVTLLLRLGAEPEGEVGPEILWFLGAWYAFTGVPWWAGLRAVEHKLTGDSPVWRVIAITLLAWGGLTVGVQTVAVLGD